jgi:uncharacterized protein HemY
MWFPGLDDYIARQITRAWRHRGERAAERIARRYARLRPKHPGAQALLGNLLVRTDRHQEADALLTRFREAHRPTDPEVGWVLAQALIGQRKLDVARQMLEEERKTFPNSRLPYLALAEIAARDNGMEEALRLAAEAEARTEPTDYGGQWELAVLLSAFPQTLSNAEILARRAADRLPHDGVVQLHMAELLELRGDPESEVYIERARRSWNGREPLESVHDKEMKLLRRLHKQRSADT